MAGGRGGAVSTSPSGPVGSVQSEAAASPPSEPTHKTTSRRRLASTLKTKTITTYILIAYGASSLDTVKNQTNQRQKNGTWSNLLKRCPGLRDC